MQVNYSDIGKRIKEIRLQKEITQEILAEKADVSIPHLSNIEHGKTKLGLPTIVKIANALSVTVDDLMCDSLTRGADIYQNKFSALLSDCSRDEARVITDMAKAMKKSLREGKTDNSDQ